MQVEFKMVQVKVKVQVHVQEKVMRVDRDLLLICFRSRCWCRC